MKFNKIVLVDKTGLRNWAITDLQKFSEHEIEEYSDYPTSDAILIDRIGSADCVFVSWNTHISKRVLKVCSNLKYIGMCCSLYDESSANVDVEYARSKNIQVSGVSDYGDEGLIEFIIAELIRLIKGLGENQWKEEPAELTNRKLGIIGMGATGQMLADRASAFKMEVNYYSRSRKLNVEKNGANYMPLDELLSKCEIISTHLPKNTYLLEDKEFELFGNGKILINTSLGLTFNKDSFLHWISCGDNYAIFDGDGVGHCQEEFKRHSQIIINNKVGGWTAEAKDRLSNKTLENLRHYIKITSGVNK